MNSVKKHHTNCLRIRISTLSYPTLYFPQASQTKGARIFSKRLRHCVSPAGLRGTNTVPSEQSWWHWGHPLRQPGWVSRCPVPHPGFRRRSGDGHTSGEAPKPPHLERADLHPNPEYTTSTSTPSAAGFAHFVSQSLYTHSRPSYSSFCSHLLSASHRLHTRALHLIFLRQSFSSSAVL